MPPLERCQSGRMGLTRNQVCPRGHPGFESLPLRHAVRKTLFHCAFRDSIALSGIPLCFQESAASWQRLRRTINDLAANRTGGRRPELLAAVLGELALHRKPLIAVGKLRSSGFLAAQRLTPPRGWISRTVRIAKRKQATAEGSMGGEEANRTTKPAAAWNPPRLMKYRVDGTGNDNLDGPASWEGQCSPAGVPIWRPNYRMPTSVERVC